VLQFLQNVPWKDQGTSSLPGGRVNFKEYKESYLGDSKPQDVTFSPEEDKMMRQILDIDDDRPPTTTAVPGSLDTSESRDSAEPHGVNPSGHHDERRRMEQEQPDPSSLSEIQQPRPSIDQESTVRHGEMTTAYVEFDKLIKALEKKDTKAVDQGIARMEQLSKTSNFIRRATRAIKDEKPENQLFFLQEFQQMAARQLTQLHWQSEAPLASTSAQPSKSIVFE